MEVYDSIFEKYSVDILKFLVCPCLFKEQPVNRNLVTMISEKNLHCYRSEEKVYI